MERYEIIIPLKEIIVDDRARNGTWCMKPYPDHPKGCPNYPDCIKKRPHFNSYKGFEWVAVVLKFDLKDHAERMGRRHPNWTERQCRNLLFWQPAVNKALKIQTEKLAFPLFGDVVLDRPEANGVHVFDTMEKHGLILEKKDPDIIHKIMFVGRPRALKSQ